MKYCCVFQKSIYLDFIYFVWGLECFPWLSDFGVPSECFPFIAWDCWALPNTRHGSKYHLLSCSTNINAFSNIHIYKLKLTTNLAPYLLFQKHSSQGCMMAISCHFGTSLNDHYITLHYYQVFCVYFTILLVAHNLVLVYHYFHSY